MNTIRYSKLILIEDLGRCILPNTVTKKRYWKLLCDCGNTVIAAMSHVKCGNIKSCGCFRREASYQRGLNNKYAKTHGKSGLDLTYQTYYSMLFRCNNPKFRGYKYYGARGIKVCDRWLDSFENFLEDMGERPEKDYCIDRVNPDGNYEPKNCRWITKSENATLAMLKRWGRNSKP